FLKMPQGIGVPSIRAPSRNRATNVSSLQKPSRPFGLAVMLGVTYVLPFRALGSFSPPANGAPTYLPVLWSRSVWHEAQSDTDSARYLPRSMVAPRGAT